jgi:hypothetical protein
VPIVAILNKSVEIQASLVPMGGGRRRLQLNARTRGELEILKVADYPIFRWLCNGLLFRDKILKNFSQPIVTCYGAHD